MTPFKLAHLNLIRRTVPTVISVLAIAISVACGGMLLRLYILSESRFVKMAKPTDAIVGAKAGGIEILLNSLNNEGEYPGYLPFKLYESITHDVAFEDGTTTQNSHFIQAVIPVVYFAKYKNYRVMGTNETFFNRVRPQDQIPLTQGHWASGPAEIVVGSEIAEHEGLSLGQKIALTPWVGKEPHSEELLFTVVGIGPQTKTVWDTTLFSNVPQAQEVIKKYADLSQSIWGENVLNYFFIYLNPNGDFSLINLIDKRTVGQAVFPNEARQKLEDLTGAGKKLGLFMTFLILFLSGLSVAAMLVTRFDAMNVQLAVLRAIGYKKTEIASWLLWEGILLGAVACVIGALLDLILFPLLRSALGSALPSTELVDSYIYQSYPVWGVAIFATVLAVAIPMIRVNQQDTHSALKGL